MSSHTPPAPSSTTATILKETGIPENYVDMRYRGLGFVWDFGWRRTEEGMEWEMKDWENTKKRYGLIEEVEKKGWMKGLMVRLRDWMKGFLGKVWGREGSLIGDW